MVIALSMSGNSRSKCDPSLVRMAIGKGSNAGKWKFRAVGQGYSGGLAAM